MLLVTCVCSLIVLRLGMLVLVVLLAFVVRTRLVAADRRQHAARGAHRD